MKGSITAVFKEAEFWGGATQGKGKSLFPEGGCVNFPVNRDEIRECGKNSLLWKEISGIR